MLLETQSPKTLERPLHSSAGLKRRILPDDVSVYLVDMPVREMVVPSGLCSWTIYISSRLSYQGQREAYVHALRHILRDDWEREDVQGIEKEAHS